MAHVKILLVDDETEFVTPLAERLDTRGFDVSTAYDGQAGLDLIEHTAFDAIVLDMMMPGMDGMETLKRMLERQPDLQIVMLTGHAQLEQGIAAVKAGAADYLEKPIKFARLLDKINEAKDKTAALREERAQHDVDDIMKRKGW
jgi:DNA-binding NtrC family response regulator